MKSEIAKREDKNLPQLLHENSKPELFSNVRSITQAVSSEHKSLSLLKKENDKLAAAIVKVWIINLNDFLNISRKMNPAQIDETADMIVREFYYLKTSDVALIFYRMKTGFYGQFYESIDGMKIMDVFFKYAEERINYFIDEGIQEHKNIKAIDK